MTIVKTSDMRYIKMKDDEWLDTHELGTHCVVVTDTFIDKYMQENGVGVVVMSEED